MTLAKKNDPATAKAAGIRIERLTAAGLQPMHNWIIGCLHERPGCTQRELGQLFSPDDPRRIGRRLAELERMNRARRGWTRRCSISGVTAETWWPADG